MALLTQYSDVLKTTFTATSALTAGQPVSFAGALATSGQQIIGVAIEDIASTDLGTNNAVTAALRSGEVDLVANGAITAGDFIKVGSSGQFLSNGTTLDNTVVGQAKTAASGAGVNFTAYLHI